MVITLSGKGTTGRIFTPASRYPRGCTFMQRPITLVKAIKWATTKWMYKVGVPRCWVDKSREVYRIKAGTDIPAVVNY